jgi:hypothetical protein
VIRVDVHGCSIATVVMLDSAILRSALVALNWLTPARAPQHVVGTPDEALEECRSIVRKHDLNVPVHVWGHVRQWLAEGDRVAREAGR